MTPTTGRAGSRDERGLLLEVEAALGPGVDFERAEGELRGVRARAGGVWLGFDRAAVTETDDGRGSPRSAPGSAGNVAAQ